MAVLLFNRTDGGSSGAIWKALNISGLSSTSLCCMRKAVEEGYLEEEELPQIMAAFKAALPPDVCDPSSLGRIRSCTLLPTATAAVVCRQHGRSGASMAWLRAFSQPIPDAWELHEQAEQDRANLQVDLVLQDKLEALEAEQHFEVEELSFREELMTMPVFSAVVQSLPAYTSQNEPDGPHGSRKSHHQSQTAHPCIGVPCRAELCKLSTSYRHLCGPSPTPCTLRIAMGDP